jgi:hypothetical protein
VSLNNWSAATDELDEEHDKGDNQKNVDVCPDRVKTDEPHQPEDQQHYKYRPEHFVLSLRSYGLRCGKVRTRASQVAAAVKIDKSKRK